MSERALDTHGRWRSVTVSFRLSPEENATLNKLVALSGRNKRTYITERLLHKEIVVVGNPRVYKALKTQMEQIYAELRRISCAGDATPEFWDTLHAALRVYEKMQEKE